MSAQSGAGRYKCLECEKRGRLEIISVNRKEANRAARPRCGGCGSAQLERIEKKKEENNAH